MAGHNLLQSWTNSTQRIAAVSTTLATVVLSYEWFSRRQERAGKLGRLYSDEIRPVRNAALGICKDWTKTRCKTASDIIPFLERYAKLKELDDSRGPKAIPQAFRVDYDVLEEYRTKTMTYWAQEVKSTSILSIYFGSKPDCDISIVDYMTYPSSGEIFEFSTFHWAIYSVSKKITTGSATPPPIYSALLARLSPSQLKYINNYQATAKEVIARDFALTNIPASNSMISIFKKWIW